MWLGQLNLMGKWELALEDCKRLGNGGVGRMQVRGTGTEAGGDVACTAGQGTGLCPSTHEHLFKNPTSSNHTSLPFFPLLVSNLLDNLISNSSFSRNARWGI